MAKERRPTYDELTTAVVDLTALVAELRAEIAELKAQLGQNSKNSSKPPSSDGYASPTRQQQRAAARKVGKQKGEPGTNLAQVDSPDEVVVHAPTHCGSCDGDLSSAPVVDVEARQVFDIPPMKVTVTEHQAESRCCGCGATTAAMFPAGVDAPALYGPRLRALAVYFIVFQHVPYDRTRQIFSDVLGVDLSAGTIFQSVQDAAADLDDFLEVLREAIRNQEVVHFDETGARVAGKLHWVHSASTFWLTYYFVHAKRGKVAMDEGEILTAFGGIAIHDGWKPYRRYDDIEHGLCNAHHLRELNAAGVVWDQEWANKMIGLLVEIKNSVEAAIESGKAELDAKTLHGFHCRYGKLIAEGKKVNPQRARRKQSKTFNLLKRLDEQREDVLRFATDFRVPFDNNQAERDIRMVKLQQKISGCWRTFKGAAAYLRVRSYISTARKQGKNPLDVLVRLFEGDVWMPTALPAY